MLFISCSKSIDIFIVLSLFLIEICNLSICEFQLGCGVESKVPGKTIQRTLKIRHNQKTKLFGATLVSSCNRDMKGRRKTSFR